MSWSGVPYLGDAYNIGAPYVGELGKKPSNPSFLYDFTEGTGTSVADRFGNSGTLTLNGTLGTAWTANYGFITPSTVNATSSTGYGLTAMPVLTPGSAFVVGWRWIWPSAKPGNTEIVLNLGRSTASTYAAVQFGLNSSGIINCLTRGVGASAIGGTGSAVTFGSSTLYVTERVYTCLFHVEVNSTGLLVSGFLDSVQVGAEQQLLWSANGGTTPTEAAFVDGLTLLSNRTGASGYAQYVGGGSGGTTSLHGVYALKLNAPDVYLAQQLAIEMHHNPRFVGKIMRSV